MMIRFRTSSTADSSVWVRRDNGDIAWWNAYPRRAHSRASRHVPEGIGGPPHAGGTTPVQPTFTEASLSAPVAPHSGPAAHTHEPPAVVVNSTISAGAPSN